MFKIDSHIRVISIEGNIGVGKSTFLDNLESYYKIKGVKGVMILKEPLEHWMMEDSNNKDSILTKYYKDPVKYCFSFQAKVLDSLIELLLKSISENPDCNVFICERSLSSSLNVFSKLHLKTQNLTMHNYKILERMYDEILKITGYTLNSVIYLDCPVGTCYARIHKRNRACESEIDLCYLKKCEVSYKEWLNNVPHISVNVHDICVDKIAEYIDGQDGIKRL
jgi:deoxyadenosine/deoxycytidine kinase